MSTLQPVFTHDCEECRFLGTILHVYQDETTGPVDLWVHEHEQGDNTYIARFSNEGPDYRSFPGSLVSTLPAYDPVALAWLVHLGQKEGEG